MEAVERIKFMNHSIFHLKQQEYLCETNRDGLLTQNGMKQLQALRDAQILIREIRNQ